MKKIKTQGLFMSQMLYLYVFFISKYYEFLASQLDKIKLKRRSPFAFI